MSRGVNKVILVGTLGADPELRQTKSGSSVCNMRIATNEVRPNPDNPGDRIETTEWHNIVLFKRLAELADRYLRKGSQVYIEGKLRTRKWQDREGNNRFSTEIIANEMQFLNTRGGGGGGNYGSQSGANYDDSSSVGNTRDRTSSNAAAGAAAGGDEFDDDIPF